MVTKKRLYRDSGGTGKLNFPYYCIKSMFWQIYTANVPEQIIFNDYSIYSDS